MLEPITKNEIEDLISKHHTSMSQYQIDHFVVGEKLTPHRILRQILLELETRYKNLKLYQTDIKIEELEVKLLEQEVLTCNGIDKEIKELKIFRRNVEIDALKKNVTNMEYEIGVLEKEFSVLKEKCGDMEQLLLDENGEEEYWINKFIKEAQVDIMTTGRIGKGVLDAIMSMPQEHQNLIVQNAVSHAASSNVYISQIEQASLKGLREDSTKLMLDTLVVKSDEEDSE